MCTRARTWFERHKRSDQRVELRRVRIRQVGQVSGRVPLCVLLGDDVLAVLNGMTPSAHRKCNDSQLEAWLLIEPQHRITLLAVPQVQ